MQVAYIRAKGPEEFTHEVTFQASNHLRLRLPLLDPPLTVDTCSWTVAETDDRDHVQGAIRLPVFPVVQAVPHGSARGRGQGGDAAQLSEGGLRPKAVDGRSSA